MKSFFLGLSIFFYLASAVFLFMWIKEQDLIYLGFAYTWVVVAYILEH